MPKVMLINVTHSEESRVGIINEGVLESFEIESLSREHLKGNIYKGVVHRIHPALEAAFVDIGAERDAFLPLDEICFRNLARPPAQKSPGGGGDTDNGRQRRRIREVLRPGEEILVQIAKEQFANKPPTLTTFYSLPGRYLVLLPGSDDTGISRRIEGEERIRLRKLVADLQPQEGFGVIVRTAAAIDEDSSELERDLAYLQRLWESVQETAKNKRSPGLVYREHDIVLRTIRDFFAPDIDEIHIDNEEVFERARDFFRNVMPAGEQVLHFYRGEQPIFSAFDVESQIELVFKRRVPLRSGGSIVIDTTEALTAIDVNSGGSVRGPNPEETAFRTNQEAVAEVTRQLRLRDIGGLIVIDFIDMREPRHVHEIEQAMRQNMQPDKARHEVGRISRFGLMQVSRQRLRPAAMATTYTSCPMCDGHGAVRTTESAALVALRKVHNRVALGDIASVNVSLPTSVAVYLLNQKRDELVRLEHRYDTQIQVHQDDRLMPHEVQIDARQRAKREKTEPAVRPGAVAVAEEPVLSNQDDRETTDGTAAADGPTTRKRRRRRGRRRGSGLRAAAAIGEALAALGSAAIGQQDGNEANAAPAPAGDHMPAQPRASGHDEPPTAAAETAAPGAAKASAAKRRRRTATRSARARKKPAPTTEAAAVSPSSHAAATAQAGTNKARRTSRRRKTGEALRAKGRSEATAESSKKTKQADTAARARKRSSRRPRKTAQEEQA